MRFHRHNLASVSASAAFVLCALLMSCAKDAPALRPAPRPAVKHVDMKPICGSVKTYSSAEMNALAAALADLDVQSPIVGAFGDYQRMRNEQRACVKAAGSAN